MFNLSFNRLLTLILTTACFTSGWFSTMSWAEQSAIPEMRRYKATSGTQKVAKGTILKLTLSSTLDSRSAQIGESFTALVAEDLFGSN
ncbi:MAG: hypothetical protein NTW61_06795, partial [Candidatus Melainabacteria bacterium]|nr:hypothetical protein [Candidatus Melainabacteria bacterium]